METIKYSDLIDLAATISDREPMSYEYDLFYALAQDLSLGCDWGRLDEVATELGDLFQISPINTWYCSSSRVGLIAYYLDNELIGFSYLAFRKASPIFRWVSIELVLKLKKAIYECVAKLENAEINMLDDSPIDPEWTRARVFVGYWD
jgi:hypothetical protein